MADADVPHQAPARIDGVGKGVGSSGKEHLYLCCPRVRQKRFKIIVVLKCPPARSSISGSRHQEQYSHEKAAHIVVNCIRYLKNMPRINLIRGSPEPRVALQRPATGM